MAKSNLISDTREAVRESPKEIFNWFLISARLLSVSAALQRASMRVSNLVFFVDEQSANRDRQHRLRRCYAGL